jgi:hypothetical protein
MVDAGGDAGTDGGDDTGDDAVVETDDLDAGLVG